MVSEVERFRKAVEANVKATNALREAIVSFHREWRNERVKNLDLCTCPWFQDPRNLANAPLGHHLLCPSLTGEHHAGDGCGNQGHGD